MENTFYAEYVGHALASIADNHKELGRRRYFDLGGGCNSALLDEECLYLLAWAMAIEGRDDLIPYLVDRGVSCEGSLCTATGLLIGANTGLLTKQPGVTVPLINNSGIDPSVPGAVSGSDGTIGGSTGGSTGGSSGGETGGDIIIPPGGSTGGGTTSGPTPQQVTNWNTAVAASRIPRPLEYIVGVDADGPKVDEITFQHPDMLNWYITLFINRIPQTQKQWDGTYFTKPAASDILTLTGMKWAQGDLVQIIFQSYDVPASAMHGIVTEEDGIQIITEDGQQLIS